MKLFVVCWAGVRAMLTQAVAWLNGLGLVMLLYILQNPTAPAELIDLVPVGLQPIARVVLPFIWFSLVQRAKTFDAKRAAQGVSQ